MKPIGALHIFHTQDGKKHVMSGIGSEEEILKQYGEGTIPLYTAPPPATPASDPESGFEAFLCEHFSDDPAARPAGDDLALLREGFYAGFDSFRRGILKSLKLPGEII